MEWPPSARHQFSARQRGLTELRPGNYVYFDRTQVALGSASLDDCALTVLATVVSTHPGRLILDAGSKTLTNDAARGIAAAPGYGAVLNPDGSVDEYIRLVESYWNNGSPRHRVISNLGRKELLAPHAEALLKILKAGARRPRRRRRWPSELGIGE